MVFDVSGISIAPWVPLAWGILVGLVFSLVGAGGGIIASVGLISVLGLTDANLLKPMAQMLTLASPLVAVPSYYKQRRLVLGLAALLGAGGVVGALIGSTLSVRYLGELGIFKPVFGLFVLLITLQLAWRLVGLKRSSDSRAGRAAAAFEGRVREGGAPETLGVEQLRFSAGRFEFRFGNERFRYSPWIPFLVALGIAVISSALGVGGGFLLVPFMSIVLGLPMTIVAGTAALAIFISSVASISNYVFLGVRLDLPLLALLLAGTVAGSWLGPRLSRYMRETWLRAMLAAVLFLISIRYLGPW
ncbi:MAG: sulfite exporter TauE/SafE family protein [Betaproteobacteria bacterium]|nr:sulfite exporter TauE/SafE family protein [Betaproteobacteria bacterium]